MTKPSPKTMMIHKLDEKGEELWVYAAQVLEQTDTLITLEAQFDRDDVEIAGLQLRHGDRFVETFYFDRWYNIFAIYRGGTGRFKGWYCNVTRPAWVNGNHLYAEDLALDLVVLPDRRTTVVDQEEFDQLVISNSDRQKAHQALAELIQMAQNATGPFITGA